MLISQNGTKSIFPLIEVLIKKNHAKYSLSSVRIDSVVHNFRGIPIDVLFDTVKNIGGNITGENLKFYDSSFKSNINGTLCLLGKDMVIVEYNFLPKITLSRYFFRYDSTYLIICNGCYRSTYTGKLNTFDMVLHLKTQNLERYYRNEEYSKIALIYRSSCKIVLGEDTKSSHPILYDYGIFYILYSFFIYIIKLIMAFKIYVGSTFFYDLDIEKLFIECFLSNLDTSQKN
ncbi:putative transmembrane domain-containing protein [Cryptosporidium canis]|uniref:Transmembrane domain-containing protein n=1 Tax=Cryptosporidium canis TaxID=195482 RepID=A0A9D5DLG1_9CRYT|nr:putative transmembrane domain-containing protein [Cryptosporidium canis]